MQTSRAAAAEVFVTSVILQIELDNKALFRVAFVVECTAVIFD
jgi:hypothetical protein